MKLEAFEKLMQGRRFGEQKKGAQSGRVLKALRLILVGGKTVTEAALMADGVSRSAVYQAMGALKVLPRQKEPQRFERCPHCHQAMPGRARKLSQLAKSNGR
jgi:hypothetical protein